MLKIMVLGSEGMAGHMIVDYLKSLECYTIIPINRTHCDFYGDPTGFQFDYVYNRYMPDIIINCIGILIGKANAIENINETININSLLPHFLSQFSAKIIHLSTDCVFSGLTGPYSVDSPTDAIDTYGKTKVLGELNNEKDLTIRTSIIGPELKDGTGLFHWVLNSQKIIPGYINIFWSGVTTLELAKYIQYILSHPPSTPIVQVTNNQCISKAELLKMINSQFELKKEIHPQTVGRYNSRHLFDNIGYKVPSYEIMIKELNEYMKRSKRSSHDYNVAKGI